ncbi:MAG: hypothetical protein IPO12_09215 [Flavobacteriales bacterium]|nr:hypothetical protein [Flavobacteriales bacterium]
MMRQLTPFTVMLAVNLEPVYTILIAPSSGAKRNACAPAAPPRQRPILVCLFVNGWLQRRRDPDTHHGTGSAGQGQSMRVPLIQLSELITQAVPGRRPGSCRLRF